MRKTKLARPVCTVFSDDVIQKIMLPYMNIGHVQSRFLLKSIMLCQELFSILWCVMQYNTSPHNLFLESRFDLENVWSIKNVALKKSQDKGDQLNLNVNTNFYSRHGGLKGMDPGGQIWN